MKAIILAGGKGTRLKPYTTVFPKPLVPVGNKAVLEILIERLESYGIKDLTLCVNHLAELIIAYFGNGRKWGVEIKYSREDKFLSTVAPIKLIRNLPEDFLVMNGDLLTDIDFKKLYQYHLKNRALLTAAVYSRKVKIDFGVIDIDKRKNTAVGFREKPELNLSVCMGVYMFNKKVLKYVPYNTPFGIDDLMHRLLEEEQAIKIYPYKGHWLDIGNPSDYEKANSIFKAKS